MRMLHNKCSEEIYWHRSCCFSQDRPGQRGVVVFCIRYSEQPRLCICMIRNTEYTIHTYRHHRDHETPGWGPPMMIISAALKSWVSLTSRRKCDEAEHVLPDNAPLDTQPDIHGCPTYGRRRACTASRRGLQAHALLCWLAPLGYLAVSVRRCTASAGFCASGFGTAKNSPTPCCEG